VRTAATALIAALACLASVIGQADVPANRLRVLSRGANITTAYNAKDDVSLDMQSLRAAGFQHVRVLVDEADIARPAGLAKLDRTVAQGLALHLGVIICMTSGRHPWEPPARDAEPAWTVAWKTLAARYGNTSPDYVFFELANEPKLNGPDWAPIQERLLTAVRRYAPAHTVLLTGSPHSTVWSLPEQPLTDDDVAYVWHLYAPMVFSHQGADWSPEYLPFAGLAYPPDPANIKPIRTRRTAEALDRYAREGAGAIGREVDAARRWAESHHLPLVVTEFGVYHVAAPDSRERWLSDARHAIEAAGEGWTVWEYQGGFGVTPLIKASPMMQALGLGARENLK
jgi:hypothetical protein